MKTFTEVYNELRSHNRNASTIQLLKAAGENAIVLDKGQCVAEFVNGVLTQVTPVPVGTPGVIIDIDPAADKADETVMWRSNGKTIVIDDPQHEPVVITLDTTTDEGKDAAEKLNDMFDEENN